MAKTANPDLVGLYANLLEEIGEDPKRDGLLKTPERCAKAIVELTSGYKADIDAIINGALFDVEYNEMVLVKNITFYSLCEHHLLPFFGKAHVAYLPGKKVLGLSKIPRLVQAFARRLQVQERLTKDLAETLMSRLAPAGVGVIIEARHFCMEMRGIRSPESPTVTSAMLGAFKDDARTRQEFLELIRKNAS